MEERLTSKSVVRDLLRRHDFRMRKKYGQNFLLDENILQKIVAAAGLKRTDQVLEIGPGIGTLTKALAAVAGRVVAVEIDRALEPLLNETIGHLPNVELLFADALKIDLDSVFNKDQARYIVANLPYYITSPLLKAFLQLEPKAERLVLLMQREVSERLLALPGSAAYGGLSVYIQALAQVELVGLVPRQVFYPVPDVESAIVALSPMQSGQCGIISLHSFELTNRALFGQRRKTIFNALKGSPTLQAKPAVIEKALLMCAIDPTERGENLGVSQIIKLANTLYTLREE